jgi:hypothetical protein
MLIRWTGGSAIKAREYAGYRWDASNGFAVEIEDPATVIDLLTLPGQPFVPSNDEPLTNLPGVGEGRIADFAMVGIGSMSALAEADESMVRLLSRQANVGAKAVREWVAAAKGIVGSPGDSAVAEALEAAREELAGEEAGTGE